MKHPFLSLSPAIRAFPGKSGPGGRWLPAWMHMFDAARCAAWLVDVRYPNLYRISGMSKDEFRRYVILCALLHDVGKFTAAFLWSIIRSISDHRLVLERAGIVVSDEVYDRKRMKHALSGEAILLSLGLPKGFSSAVGAHHGFPVSGEDGVEFHMKAHAHDYHSGDARLWEGIWKEWLDVCLAEAGYLSVLDVPSWVPQPALVCVSCIVVLADWMASCTDYFGLIGPDDMPDSYPEARAEEGVRAAGLTVPWPGSDLCMTDGGFKERFGFLPNGVQKGFLDLVRNVPAPGLFILEAPMGCGKTEAALASAELFASRFGFGGTYVGLPTKATAAAAYARVAKWAESAGGDDYHSISLISGDAAYSPDFASLPRDLPEVGEERDTGLLFQTFFSGSRRSLMPDLCVATIDRILDAALRRKYGLLPHLGICNKVIIIDEAHAYDTYMSTYLDTVLRWLGEYGVPVVILSATLTHRRRADLLDAYTGHGVPQAAGSAYPRVSYALTDGSGGFLPLPDDGIPKRRVKVVLVSSEEEAYGKMREASDKGACVGAVFNTVKRSIAAAGRFKGRSTLLHSQFVAPDRAEIEKEILRRAGREGIGRKCWIVIGTQVLEMSLDLDFDLEATDICPIDLLLQRIGRLFRHLWRERPDWCGEAVCYVICSDEAVRAAERIYGAWPIQRALDILKGMGSDCSIALPDDIDRLVEAAYVDASVLPSLSEERRAQGIEHIQGRDRAMRRAEAYLLAKPQAGRREKTLHGMLSVPSGASDAGEAAVRDGAASVEAVVLVRRADDMLGFLPWRDGGVTRFRPDEVPDPDLAKRIAGESMRLGYSLSGPWIIGRTLRDLSWMTASLPGLSRSPWLAGRQFLVLDERLEGAIGGRRVCYDRELGLVDSGLKSM